MGGNKSDNDLNHKMVVGSNPVAVTKSFRYRDYWEMDSPDTVIKSNPNIFIATQNQKAQLFLHLLFF